MTIKPAFARPTLSFGKLAEDRETENRQRASRGDAGPRADRTGSGTRAMIAVSTSTKASAAAAKVAVSGTPLRLNRSATVPEHAAPMLNAQAIANRSMPTCCALKRSTSASQRAAHNP